MARGTVVNEQVVSMANTESFREGYDRSGLGTSASAKDKGRFVWDPERKALVRPWEVDMDTTRMAKHASVIVGREYENVPSPRGDHVFTGRTDYNRYMKRHNLANASDFDRPGGCWDKAEAKRKQGFSTPEQQKDRRDRIGRRLYEIEKMPQKKYEEQVREASIRRAKRGTATPTDK